MSKHTATKAIIMAAGIGNRLQPITNEIPKPLIEVNGKKMIETVLDGLIQNGIKEIYIVTGHLKEKFLYLPEKYHQIKLILLENPYFETCNNISSLYVAREHLGNCIITDGDLIIHNPEILNPTFEASGYCSAWATVTREWLQTIDETDSVLTCSRTGGENGWQLFSISFWSMEDGMKLRKHLEELFVDKKETGLYWDDVVMFYYKDHYHLKIRKINSSDVIEIDNLYELIEIDPSYEKVER